MWNILRYQRLSQVITPVKHNHMPQARIIPHLHYTAWGMSNSYL